jgi:hypothetical protein
VVWDKKRAPTFEVLSQTHLSLLHHLVLEGADELLAGQRVRQLDVGLPLDRLTTHRNARHTHTITD